MTRKIIIIGGVAGGASCAARLRRLCEKDEIILFEKGEYISFANCGLPYYIGDIIKSRDSLLVTTSDKFKKRFNIDVRNRSEVIKINRDKKEVKVCNLENASEYTEKYDYLVLSPGAMPVRPNMPGIDDDLIFTLRTVPDADKIKQHIQTKAPKNVVVVGGGFIGLEMAENFVGQGLDVTIVEKMNQVMPVLDYDIANHVSKYMAKNGVKFILGTGISGFEKKGDKLFVMLEDGSKIETDFAVLCIGVRPDTILARDAGIDVEKNGAIKVDRYLKTNDPNIFAIGDAVIISNPIVGTQWGVALAGPANKQARVVADIINNMDEEYQGAIGTSIVKIFDRSVASTGCSESYLKKNNIKYEKSFIYANDHASYYPDAQQMLVKLIFDPIDGKLLGAQAFGKQGVDKRIDVIASLIKQGKTTQDLKDLDLAYAPPYGSAKDPVNIAGCVADNIVNKKVVVCHWHDVEGFQKDKDKNMILDVRTEKEYSKGTIEGAINIPIDELRERLNEVPKNKRIVIFCRVGLRGYIAYRILAQNGYDAVNLSGGYLLYKQAC
ncbi:MAG: CoA-disulfide reductase [Deltaproteobacteria bacterium CG07_land_8_20_14_0_80_38_7]|nr:MAG: CoA-disulfide reductase [Deltaproteobacteria bacterium CG07_land_8_20_14_0_80_38_7]